MKLSIRALIFSLLLLGQARAARKPIELNWLGRCLYYFAGRDPWPGDTHPRPSKDSKVAVGVRLLTLVDGRQEIFKIHNFKTQPRLEVMAYKLDQLLKLGVVPETQYRIYRGEKGSAQRFIANRKILREPVAVNPRILYLDFLMNNHDRRVYQLDVTDRWPLEELAGKNLLVEEGSNAQWGIDYGFAKIGFDETSVENRIILQRTDKDPGAIFPGVDVIQTFDGLSDRQWKKAMGDDMTPEEIAFVKRQHQRLKVVFQAHGLIP